MLAAHLYIRKIMKIAKDAVVSMHYKLTDNDGNVLDSSEGSDPLVYLQGHRNIIPGLETQMKGKAVGDKFTAKVDPSQGYGEVNPALVQQVPKTNFPDPDQIQIGMQFQTMTEQGPIVLTVKELHDDAVTVDGNHPLAGVALNFDVEITDIRAASEEEIAHGHVHGPGGDQHD
jgi:FKBP-type peptidyl-prolyl cis-trans isomerase SlyD